ncbi:Hypothetical protein POVN_LOCUS15 [uncultured virus]|nr:Hypothetical protein POVN_LOCUS15 [uncultured virus]
MTSSEEMWLSLKEAVTYYNFRVDNLGLLPPQSTKKIEGALCISERAIRQSIGPLLLPPHRDRVFKAGDKLQMRGPDLSVQTMDGLIRELRFEKDTAEFYVVGPAPGFCEDKKWLVFKGHKDNSFKLEPYDAKNCQMLTRPMMEALMSELGPWGFVAMLKERAGIKDFSIVRTAKTKPLDAKEATRARKDAKLHWHKRYCRGCKRVHPIRVKVCSACGKGGYCSAACQKADYAEHKKTCKPKAQAPTTESTEEATVEVVEKPATEEVAASALDDVD